MSEQPNQNSTEKLLNTIRGKDHPPPDDAHRSSQPTRQEITLKSDVKQSLTAGVHFSDRHLSLVLIGRKKQGADPEPVKWAHIEIPDRMETTSPRFASFFRSTLSDFLGSYKNVAVWTAIDSRDLKLRNLNIPDVPIQKMANAALWGLKKEVDLDTDTDVFDFEYIEDTQASGIKKKNVVAFSGDKKQIHFLRQLFANAGHPLTGITTNPFAMQNFVRTQAIEVGPIPLIMVHVSRFYSEITCLSENGVLLTRNIKTGTASFVETLLDTADGTAEEVDVQAVLTSGLDRDSAEFAAIEPAASRLLDKINRTGDYCSNNFVANEPISRFLFFGETDDCSAFMEYAAQQIPRRVEKLSVFEDPSLSLAIRMPEGAQDRGGVIPALGIALSDNRHTPNFLYTYLEKTIQSKYRKMNLAIAAAGICCLLVLGGVWTWLSTQKNQILQETAALETQLAQYTPAVTRQALSLKIDAARKKVENINRYAGDFLPLAVIHEICTLTPAHIDIISLDAVFSTETQPAGSDTRTSPKNAGLTKTSPRVVMLKGIVNAEFTDLEPMLTGYVSHLYESPLFGSILLKEKQAIQKHRAASMAFTVDMEIR